jgi:hypothetical protein
MSVLLGRKTRLTATVGALKPGAVTVWVEHGGTGPTVKLRAVRPQREPDAVPEGGWMFLSAGEWGELKRCVDAYLIARPGR